MAERRDVTVKLAVEESPQTARAVERLAQQFNKADAARRKMFAGLTADAANAARDSAKTVSASYTDQLGQSIRQQTIGLARSIAGPAAIAGTVVNMTEAGIQSTLADPYQTTGQRGRMFFRQAVPFGERIQRNVDAISGRTRRYIELETERQLEQAEAAGQQQMQQARLQFNPQQQMREERARQAQAARALEMPTIDRQTAVGERAFRELSRLLPVQREILRAEREVLAVRRERTTLEGQVGVITTKQNDLIQKRQRLEKDLEKPESEYGVPRQELLQRATVLDQQITQQTELARAANERLADARAREAEAQAQVRRLRAEEQEQRAANLEERAQTAAAGAQRLGGMMPFQRAFAVQALQMLQDVGPEGLPPQLLAQAQGIAPQTVAKILEQRGARSEEFQRLRQLAPADFAGDPEELRRQANEARNEAERMRVANEASLARASADAGRDLGQLVVQAIRVTTDAAKREIMNSIGLQRNQP